MKSIWEFSVLCKSSIGLKLSEDSCKCAEQEKELGDDEGHRSERKWQKNNTGQPRKSLHGDRVAPLLLQREKGTQWGLLVESAPLLLSFN